VQSKGGSGHSIAARRKAKFRRMWLVECQTERLRLKKSISLDRQLLNCYDLLSLICYDLLTRSERPSACRRL
jgi:hypothetical protein